MNQVRIIIEKSKDFYSSYADNVDGVYGGGATIEEAKQSALNSISLLKEFNSVENIPEVLLSDYKIVFCVDTDLAKIK